MKAKEYADLYNNIDSSKKKTIEEIGTMFIEELFDIVKKRNCKVDDACLAVFKELNQKWKAFAKITGINPDGFKLIVEHIEEFKPLVKRFSNRMF